MDSRILKYLNLEINTKEFVSAILQDKNLYNEISSYFPTPKSINEEHWINFPYALSLRTHSFDLGKMLKYRFSYGKNPSGRSALYDFIYKIADKNGFSLNYNDYYQKRFKLLMDILPSYIGGESAEEYIELYISSLPTTLSDNQKKDAIKNFIKESFVCENKKKPQWIQEPEWPILEKPMIFISQTKHGQQYTYLFKDAKTGIIKEVTQLK